MPFLIIAADPLLKKDAKKLTAPPPAYSKKAKMVMVFIFRAPYAIIGMSMKDIPLIIDESVMPVQNTSTDDTAPTAPAIARRYPFMG